VIYLIPPLAGAIAIAALALATDLRRRLEDRRAHRQQQSESIATWTPLEESP
jgi:hypothetical protein